MHTYIHSYDVHTRTLSTFEARLIAQFDVENDGILDCSCSFPSLLEADFAGAVCRKCVYVFVFMYSSIQMYVSIVSLFCILFLFHLWEAVWQVVFATCVHVCVCMCVCMYVCYVCTCACVCIRVCVTVSIRERQRKREGKKSSFRYSTYHIQHLRHVEQA